MNEKKKNPQLPLTDESENANIQLTVVRSTRDVEVDLRDVWTGLKRLFPLWLTLALALGLILSGLGLLKSSSVYPGGAVALIQALPDTGNQDASVPTAETAAAEVPAEAAAAPVPGTAVAAETSSDLLRRVTSPALVEAALADVGLDPAQADALSAGLQVAGVLSDEMYDRMTLYYKAMVGKESVQTDVLEALLDAREPATRFTVTLNYAGLTREGAPLSRQMAIRLLNALLNRLRKEAPDGAISLLVPAVAPAAGRTAGGWVRKTLLAEALLLVIWIAAAVGYGFSRTGRKE